MEKNSIIEGNKAIAEFMGSCGLETKGVPNMGIVRNNAKYHSSWSWLMDAWKKFYEKIILSEWYKDNTDETSQSQLEMMEYSLCSANLPGAFKHFVLLLKWYQNQILNNTINHGC